MIDIELTSRCTLKCPRCARTDRLIEEGRLSIDDADINALNKFLDLDLTDVTIMLNGNLGDPIYHPQFLTWYEMIKKRGAKVLTITNGSYRGTRWWEKFAEVVDDKDRVMFSIDGLPANFTQYRINGDWKSIEKGIKIMVQSPAKIEWKYIRFAYNQTNIAEARALSVTLGIDRFFEVESNRWISASDPFKPTPKAIIPVRLNKFVPQCKIEDRHHISARGYFYPCCFSADYRLVRATMFENNEEFNIRNTTYSKLLATNSIMDQFFNSLTEKSLLACGFCCKQ